MAAREPIVSRGGASRAKGAKVGRGHDRDARPPAPSGGGTFETLAGGEEGETPGGPGRSIEGWILVVTGLHPEVQEEDLLDKFGEYGTTRNINLVLDRRTGFAKGYALVEFNTKREADAAVAGLSGQPIMGQVVEVGFAVVSEKGRRATERR